MPSPLDHVDYPQRDSNPCLQVENLISWTTRRWGRSVVVFGACLGHPTTKYKVDPPWSTVKRIGAKWMILGHSFLRPRRQRESRHRGAQGLRWSLGALLRNMASGVTQIVRRDYLEREVLIVVGATGSSLPVLLPGTTRTDRPPVAPTAQSRGSIFSTPSSNFEDRDTWHSSALLTTSNGTWRVHHATSRAGRCARCWMRFFSKTRGRVATCWTIRAPYEDT